MITIIKKLISLAIGVAVIAGAVFVFKSHQPTEKILSENGKTETVMMDDTKCFVKYVDKESIRPGFGYVAGNNISVRDDLDQGVKKFVRARELYHCWDTATWGEWMGRELRANLIPAIKDPKGLWTTTWKTISDYEHMKYYWQQLQNWQQKNPS